MMRSPKRVRDNVRVSEATTIAFLLRFQLISELDEIPQHRSLSIQKSKGTFRRRPSIDSWVFEISCEMTLFALSYCCLVSCFNKVQSTNDHFAAQGLSQSSSPSLDAVAMQQ
ncbi:hypothetical protein VTO42DRAFT_8205 [Malbranchea cinnamomea]